MRFFIPLVFFALVSGLPATAQTERTDRLRSTLLPVFDGAPMTTARARAMAEQEGFIYLGVSPCAGYEICKPGTRPLLNAPVMVTITAQVSDERPIFYDVMDTPCRNIKVLPRGRCFAGYILVSQSRHTMATQSNAGGWETVLNSSFDAWQRGEWRLYRHVQLRKWTEYGSSPSAPQLRGLSNQISDADGNLLHSEYSTSSFVASSGDGSISDKDTCDAIANARTSQASLAGSVANIACEAFDAVIPGDTMSASFEVYGVDLGITWADSNYCEAVDSLGQGLSAALGDQVQASCYANPSAYFPSGNPTSSNNDDPVINIVVDANQNATVSNEEAPAEFEPPESQCRTIVNEIAVAIDGEQCTQTQTVNCEMIGGDCQCGSIEVGEPVCPD